MSFYRAQFSERFTFTLSESATDQLHIKVFMTISAAQEATEQPHEQQSSPAKAARDQTALSSAAAGETSERLIECLKFRLKDKLFDMYD